MKEATLKQAGKIISIFSETPLEQIQAIIQSGLLADIRDGNISNVDRNAFRKVLGLAAMNVFSLEVDYGRSVEDAVKAGEYDFTNSDINSKNFPTKKSGIAKIDIELVHFDRDMSTEEVLKELDKRGLRPAELHELLKIGEKYPNLQREFPIVAIGSVWQGPRGDRCCPALLDRDSSDRDLGLIWIGRRWPSRCRFAALRKYL